jgi:hypothetical protein
VTFRRSPSPFGLPIVAIEERQPARLIQEALAWLDHYQPRSRRRSLAWGCEANPLQSHERGLTSIAAIACAYPRSAAGRPSRARL